MVPLTGLEPVAHGLGNRCSIQSELRVDLVHLPGHFKIEPIKLRAYIERMYDRHYKVVWTEENPHLIFVQAGHRRVQSSSLPPKFKFKALKPGQPKVLFNHLDR